MDTDEIKAAIEKALREWEREFRKALGDKFNIRADAVFSIGDSTYSTDGNDTVFAITGAIKVGEHYPQAVKKDKLELSKCCSAPMKVAPRGDSLWYICSKCEELIVEINPR